MNLLGSRRDNDAQLFHHFKQFPRYTACGIKPDSHECLGWRMYVFHIRKSAGICMCELCGTQATTAQCGVSAGRESSDTGKIYISSSLKVCVCFLLLAPFGLVGCLGFTALSTNTRF